MSQNPGAAAPILVVGSVALDSIETPFDRRDDVVGGAAVHFSAAASLFAPVRLVGVVGADYPMAELEFLRNRGVDFGGLTTVDGPSFRWRGRYHLDMDHRDTLDLQLGVFASFRPQVPEAWLDSPVLFLANVDPDIQVAVLEQARGARLTACDTIDHWIEEKRPVVDRLFGAVDMVFLNEDEARLYADTPSLHAAAKTILGRGCRVVLIKKGENGALVIRREPDGEISLFAAAAFPLAEVVDPTGAGDVFAGGVIGSLAAGGDLETHDLRRAVVTGAVLASFAVEGFGPGALDAVGPADIAERYRVMSELVAVPGD